MLLQCPEPPEVAVSRWVCVHTLIFDCGKAQETSNAQGGWNCTHVDGFQLSHAQEVILVPGVRWGFELFDPRRPGRILDGCV